MTPALRASLTIAALALAACQGSNSSAPTPTADQAPSATRKTAGASESTEGFVITALEPSAGDASAALKAEVAKAKQKGLKPYVELWATWCGPCLAIKKSMNDPRMKAAFKGAYIVQMDVDAWGAKLDGTGFSSSVIPIFYALDEEGKPSGRKIDGGAWGDNVPENMAPPLDKFFHGS
jgi:thiol-disulfide isomerase/thioredoxin